MGHAALPPSILPRVSALVRLLGSPVDAETVGAARALGRTLAGAGCDFHDLADRIVLGATVEASVTSREPASKPGTATTAAGDTVLWRAAQRRAVAAKLRAGLHSRAFTNWEAKFAADVAEMIETNKRRRFSPRQVATAEELAAKAARWGCRA